MGRDGLVNIPLRSFAGKRALEKPKTDGIISNGIRGTPHAERSNMVRRIFTSKAFEFRNAGGELGGHRRPTKIVADGIINQLIEIREAETYHIREKRDSRGSSCGGSSSNIPSSRARVSTSIRPWTRHCEGDKGRTRSRGRTQ